MPTYEYVCDGCGHEFELLQRMSDPAVKKCPECAKLKVRRIISGGAGVIFKGSGFYETDYKRARQGQGGADRRREGGGEPPAEPKKESDGAKPDTKPAAPSSPPAQPKPDAKPAPVESKKPDPKPAARSDSAKKRGR